jgi:N-acetylglucosaminyldiphosphoundecaprenol N-acetyl-beta-D-mannosaminyltransferase
MLLRHTSLLTRYQYFTSIDLDTLNSMTENILSVPVSVLRIELLIDEIMREIGKDIECRTLSCINPHSYCIAKRNSDFFAALQNADWIIPDGVGIVLASRLLRGSIRQRITGSDVFTALNIRLNEIGGSVFFLGSSESTLRCIRDRMQLDYPNVDVAGTHSPPFKSSFSSLDNEMMVNAVNEASPDILWVGMTSPKQDLWISHNLARLNVKFAASVGAVFDFYAGSVNRAPEWMQKAGLEWLHRSLLSPSRLGRRSLLSNPEFLIDLFSFIIKPTPQ